MKTSANGMKEERRIAMHRYDQVAAPFGRKPLNIHTAAAPPRHRPRRTSAPGCRSDSAFVPHAAYLIIGSNICQRFVVDAKVLQPEVMCAGVWAAAYTGMR